MASTALLQTRRSLSTASKPSSAPSFGSRSVAGLVSGGAFLATSAAYLGNSTAARSLATSAVPSLAAGLEEPVKLYQYDVCPFCNKVQAFLEYHGVPYEKVEVNPLTKAEIKFSDYRMVPFAKVGDRQINGSAAIIESFLGESSSKLSEDEKKWFSWVDDHLVHVLPVNIYRTPGEALQSFDYITSNSNFSAWQKFSIRVSGAAIMFLIAKRSMKKYNLGDDPRKALFDAVEKWADEGLDGKLFHSGQDTPDTADLAVYGVLRSIEGNYGTWSDLTDADLPHKDAFWAWYKATKSLVDANRSKTQVTSAAQE